MEPAMNQSAAPVIEMQGVAIGALREPSLLLAEGVNWRVAPGDYWAVAGLQGSGKSDFLMTTAGLTPPVAGELATVIVTGAWVKFATRLRLALAVKV